MDHPPSIVQHDQFAKLLGIELLEVSAGRAKARLRLRPQHLNGVNIAHGGAIFTLADLAFAAACNSHGNVAVAINCSISYLKAAAAGDTLVAEAREISPPGKMAAYAVDVTSETGEVIAVFQGLAYRKAHPATPPPNASA